MAVFDYDNDGWEDIYFCGGGNNAKLFRNNWGVGFVDVTATSGLSVLANVIDQGVVAGDLDNDGDKDLVITTSDNDVKLLKNQGNGSFLLLDSNVVTNDFGWSVPVALADVNSDGFLDIYVGFYIEEWGFIFDPSTGDIIGFDNQGGKNRLYLNNGDFTFIDVTDDYGVGDTGCTYGVLFSDFDNDGDLDLITTNDFGMWPSGSNRLYLNNYPDASFTDISESHMMNIEIYGMGVCQGDFDKDGDLDYYFTNIDSNFLMINNGVSFSDEAKNFGVHSDSSGGLATTHYGCHFFDCNNDSHLDLFVAAGGINTAGYEGITVLEEDSNRLYMNDGVGNFIEVTVPSNVGSVYSARGSACFDFDKDGLLDIVVNNMVWANYSAQAELFHNVSAGTGNWLRLKLNGTLSNRDCVGCRAIFWLNGEPTLMEVSAGSSHASQSSNILHFGMGESTIVDSIVVRFPSGLGQTYYLVGANQLLELDESFLTDDTVGEKDPLLEFSNNSHCLVIAPHGEITKAELKVHDSSGRLMLSKPITSKDGSKVLVDISWLASGYYHSTIILFTEGKVFSYTFVKT